MHGRVGIQFRASFFSLSRRFSMRVAFIVAFLMGAVAGVASAADRWDGKFDLITKTVNDGGDQLATVQGGQYYKVTCTADTRVSSAQVFSDAGISKLCLLSDAGYACDSVKYSLGEKFYSKVLSLDNRIVTNSAASTCEIYQGR